MRLLAICPRVRRESGCIVASTAWRVRILTLGILYRRVVLNPVEKTLKMVSRYLWVFGRRHNVPFSSIRAVTYGYGNLSPESYFSWGHGSIDSFAVGVRLKNNKELHLFHFVGEGTFSNDGPLPDWMYWPEFTVDIAGSQEQESKMFVEVVSKMIGVKVVPPQIY